MGLCRGGAGCGMVVWCGGGNGGVILRWCGSLVWCCDGVVL